MHFLIGLLILAIVLSIPAGRILVSLLVVLSIFAIGIGLFAVADHGSSSPPTTAPAVHLATAPPPPPRGRACFWPPREAAWRQDPQFPPAARPLPAGAVPLTPADMPCNPADSAEDASVICGFGEITAKLIVYRNWLPDSQRATWERSLDPLQQRCLWFYIRGNAYRIDLNWYVPAPDGTTGAPTPVHGQVDLDGVPPNTPGYADLVAVDALPTTAQRTAYTNSLSPAARHALASLMRQHLTLLVPAGPF